MIEKTPDYVFGDQTVLKTRAQKMKEKMPNLKLIVLLCDPAKRSFSQIKHQAKFPVSFDRSGRTKTKC